MASKKDYDKVVTKRAKSVRAIDKVYEINRPAKETRNLATRLVDTDNEIKTRGYVKGSIGDPAVRRAADATLRSWSKGKKK